MAEAPRAAYVIGHISVKDAEQWAAYRRAVPATLLPWKGELVLRGGLTDVLAGRHAHRDTVLIRFPDRASVHGWYQSAAYQALIPLRSAAADLDLLVFEDA